MQRRNSIGLSVGVSNHFTPLNFGGGLTARPLRRLLGLFAVNLFTSGVRLLTDALLRRRLVPLLFRLFVFFSLRFQGVCPCVCGSQQVCVSGDSSCRELAGDSKKKKLKKLKDWIQSCAKTVTHCCVVNCFTHVLCPRGIFFMLIFEQMRHGVSFFTTVLD